MKKKILIAAAFLAFFGSQEMTAQTKTNVKAQAVKASKATQNINDVMDFEETTHQFGTLKEGVQAEYTFKFTNKGTQPIVINNARPSCGCTTPKWSKEPVKPGAEGSITAVYNTKNRPGSFTKTITVQTNQGNKVLTIKGSVTPTPKSSTPKQTSLIKK